MPGWFWDAAGMPTRPRRGPAAGLLFKKGRSPGMLLGCKQFWAWHFIEEHVPPLSEKTWDETGMQTRRHKAILIQRSPWDEIGMPTKRLGCLSHPWSLMPLKHKGCPSRCKLGWSWDDAAGNWIAQNLFERNYKTKSSQWHPRVDKTLGWNAPTLGWCIPSSQGYPIYEKREFKITSGW